MDKNITWRLLAIGSSFSLSYIFYGYFFKSLTFMITLNVVNHILYYVHEKYWENKLFNKKD